MEWIQSHIAVSLLSGLCLGVLVVRVASCERVTCSLGHSGSGPGADTSAQKDRV
jgi:hypothetical protein